MSQHPPPLVTSNWQQHQFECEKIDRKLSAAESFDSSDDVFRKSEPIVQPAKSTVPTKTETDVPSLPMPTATTSSTSTSSAAPTASVSVPKSTDEKKPEPKIPGFGTEIDEQIHESAVKSISYSMQEDDQVQSVVLPTDDVASDGDDSKIDDKLEEKSRAIISQEETEDAVAALLGESFGNDEDYSDSYADPVVEEELVPPISSMPEEDAEEMLKAVQSLNADEELDMKPYTPQSENDLQIDTDNEGADDDATVTEQTNELDAILPPKPCDMRGVASSSAFAVDTVANRNELPAKQVAPTSAPTIVSSKVIPTKPVQPSTIIASSKPVAVVSQHVVQPTVVTQVVATRVVNPLPPSLSSTMAKIPASTTVVPSSSAAAANKKRLQQPTSYQQQQQQQQPPPPVAYAPLPSQSPTAITTSSLTTVVKQSAIPSTGKS